jgi:ATP-binding cassette subfamily B protein
LAQQPREQWHEGEDRALDEYVDQARRLDRVGATLVVAVPRGWLLLGLATLCTGFTGQMQDLGQTAMLLGGTLIGWTALRRLTASMADLAAAKVAWKEAGPLFRAAARPEPEGELLSVPSDRPTSKVLEADGLVFRHSPGGPPVLDGCGLNVFAGDRILLEGSSGGGKTTFASVLAGLREPERGLLLAGGLDYATLGAQQWGKRVAAAPQFHENHVFTETFCFNLLMGRAWPPTPADVEEAEELCRDLGLGELLDKMPAGILQMVGEGGWQLSHGERSRLFLARALLQRAQMVILDESFASLDPENLHVALRTTMDRSETLMVIAHP